MLHFEIELCCCALNCWAQATLLGQTKSWDYRCVLTHLSPLAFSLHVWFCFHFGLFLGKKRLLDDEISFLKTPRTLTPLLGDWGLHTKQSANVELNKVTQLPHTALILLPRYELVKMDFYWCLDSMRHTTLYVSSFALHIDAAQTITYICICSQTKSGTVLKTTHLETCWSAAKGVHRSKFIALNIYIILKKARKFEQKIQLSLGNTYQHIVKRRKWSGKQMMPKLGI